MVMMFFPPNFQYDDKRKRRARDYMSDVKKPPRSPAISAVSREVNCSGKVKRKVKMHDGDGGHSKDGIMETDGNSITNIDRSVNGDIGSKSADAKIAGLKQSHSVAARLWSLDVSLKELELGSDSPVENGNGTSVRMMKEAWERLNKAYVYCNAKPAGMVAVSDPCADARNYNQVFIRGFVPCGLACMMMMESKADLEVVESFLKTTLRLQWNSNKKIDNYKQGIATMPASFRVTSKHPSGQTVLSGFGDNIGRVPPTDSGFWWIILLRAYTQREGNQNLSNLADFQQGIKDILNLCLVDGLDSSPTLLCADGCCMIDRRMGMYGYPIEIQALFFFALRCAKELLIKSEDCKELISRIDRWIAALSFHIQTYYWLDFERLNKIYRYKTEEYSQTTLNKFNVNPDSTPSWIFDFMSLRGGYFIGNVSPSRKDLRWFSVGNCIAILCSLATPEQANAIMDLVEAHWDDLIGEMPMKIAYPALKEYE